MTPSRWSGRVATASTFPPPGLFAAGAEEIAAVMARPEVSPGGLGAAIRMVTFFVNRAGRSLPPPRRAELHRAKALLREGLRSAPVLPAGRRRAGAFRHIALGPVRVARRGHGWVMLRPDGSPPIPVGPDGWRFLEAA